MYLELERFSNFFKLGDSMNFEIEKPSFSWFIFSFGVSINFELERL